MSSQWTCPACQRTFRQVNQRHACGVGDGSSLLRNRPERLVALYRRLESMVSAFAGVEIVTRNRYALFRTTRIFADLTVRRDALRMVVHLDRRVDAPYVIKVVPGKRQSHVIMLRTPSDLETIAPLIREAYDLARGEDEG